MLIESHMGVDISVDTVRFVCEYAFAVIIVVCLAISLCKRCEYR